MYSIKDLIAALSIGALGSISGIACASTLAAEGQPQFDHPVLTVRHAGASPPKPYLFDALEDQVPLDEAGKLSFKPSAEELGVNNWTGGLPAIARARLWFDAKGQPAKCEIIYTTIGWNLTGGRDWDDSAFGAAVCREFMAKAKFSFADWFVIPMRKGFLEREIRLTRWLTPNMPVHFTSRQDGYPIELKIGPEANDGCEISWLRIIGSESARAICDAFKVTEEAKRLDQFRKGSEQNNYNLVAYVDGKLNDGGAVGISEFYDGTKYQALYTVPKMKENMTLLKSDGDFSFYPSFEKLNVQDPRNFSARVQAVLKIGPDGQVASCQPVFSDTEPRIDNATCAQMAKTGRFKFESPPKWKGYRYWIQSIRWKTEE